MWKLLPALAVEGGGVCVLVGSEVGSGVVVFVDVGFWEGTAPFGTCGVAIRDVVLYLGRGRRGFCGGCGLRAARGSLFVLVGLVFPHTSVRKGPTYGKSKLKGKRRVSEQFWVSLQA